MADFDICIDVNDVDRAVKFYGRGLGLKVVKHEPGWAQLKAGGQTLWIMKLKAGRDGKITRSYRRHWTPVHLDFVVDDMKSAVRHAIAAGGKLDGKVRDFVPSIPAGGGGMLGRIANLSDPSGNGVDLVERPKKRSK
jgi:catechol 2,3-dioxygenase-like lactoylglutathione lyase family enzyme